MLFVIPIDICSRLSRSNLTGFHKVPIMMKITLALLGSHTLLVLFGFALFFGLAHADEFKAIKREESSSGLFAPPPALKVLAPSHFPPPTLKIGEDVQILLEPVFGVHRPDQDAVFAYAEGYKLAYYMNFMETLTSTGFRGDVVLAIAEDSIVRENVKDYLETFAQGDTNKPSVVVYQIPLDCDGTDDHQRATSKQGELDIFQMCRMGAGVYGWKDEFGHVIRSATDPRGGRTAATIRYEWYWICSRQYDKHSWIMLLDARDSFFQSDPFVGLPREKDAYRPDGLLYMFGENSNATRLGISKKNRNWLTRGYGNEVINILKDYPTICSGSTMGEQVAIETYLRAMVNEHDECEVRMTGSDQGFHNVSLMCMAAAFPLLPLCSPCLCSIFITVKNWLKQPRSGA